MEVELHQGGALDVPGLDVVNAGDVEEVVLVIVGEEPFHLPWVHAAVGLSHIDDGEVELREDIWKEMVLKGSYMFQYNGTPEMAETIVGQLMVKPEIVLKIQLELVDKQRPLDKTSAGHMVSSDLWQQLEDRRQGMRSLQDQLQVAERANDYGKHQEIQRELAGQRNRHSQQLSDWQALREDIASETDQRIEEIEKEEKMSPKKKWSKVLSRVQKFVQILTPVVSITLAVLSFTGVL